MNPGLSGPKARVLPRKSVMLEPRAAEIGSSSVIPALEVFTRGWGSRRNEQSHSKKRLAKIWAQVPAPGSPGKRTQDSSTRRKNCKISISLLLFLNFLFYIRVRPINNVVTISGAHRRDSAIRNHSLLNSLPIQAAT